MLECREKTSSMTNRVPRGSTSNLLSLLIKTVVSRMYDGREVANGCKNQSTNLKMFSTGAILDDIMGLSEWTGLWILGTR